MAERYGITAERQREVWRLLDQREADQAAGSRGMTMAEIAKRVGYVSRNGTFSQMVSAWKADRHNEAGDQITLPLDDPRWSREWWRTPTPRTNGLNGHGSTRVKQLHHQQDLDALVNENATLYSRIAELESELAALR